MSQEERENVENSNAENEEIEAQESTGAEDSEENELETLKAALAACEDRYHRVHAEVYHWKKRLEKELASGLGSISKTGDVYTITIMWDDEHTGATGTACGTDNTVDLKCYTLEIQT